MISSVSALRRQAGLLQRVAHVGDDVGVLQLLERQVDRQRRGLVVRDAVEQALALAAPLAQDPAADRHDQPGLLGERDELVGADHPALRVVPAQQRLDAADRPVAQPDHRLVVELQLVGDQRALQVGAQLQPLQDALVHLGLEQAVAALAVALGDVHRGVGVADQLVGVGAAVLGRDRDAQRAADRQLLVRGGQRRGDGLHDALGGVGRLLHALDVLQQHGELVAAEAGGGVAGADRRARGAARPG